MAAKGRYWVALWLFFLLGTLGWVVARQTSSVVIAQRLADARTRRSTAEARKASLLGRIRTGQSRTVLIPRAEALGLRLPADSEIVILQVPGGEQP
jgi:hypothetical protein